MLDRQRGVLNLTWVAVFSAVFAAVAMAALFSMRYERNLFAEGGARLAKLFGASPAARALDTARSAAGAGDAGGGALRQCLIDGKRVISNTACTDKNPTSKTLQLHDTKGFEAPKVAPPAEAAPTSQPALDKMIEKQLH